MKTCTKCGETKALDEFYPRKAQCKPCRSAIMRAWYQEKGYYAQNREKMREYGRAWRRANPHKEVERTQRRRVRKAANGVYLVTDRDYRRILESPCVACGSTQDIQVDHIIPIARGGRHAVGNLQALCRSCNTSKGAKLPIAWRTSHSASGTPHAQGGRP